MVATAKRDLKPGEILDGEGGFTVWGKLMPASDSLRLGGLPLGLAHGVPGPLGELLGLIAVASHGCERAGGDVAGEPPQGGLVVGVGEGVGAERTGGHGTQGSGASARRSRTGRYGDAVTTEPTAAEPMRATLDWGNVQPHEIWREAREGACPIIAADDTGLGPGTTYQVLSWDAADAVLRDADTFSSSINGDHIGQFMGELILAMGGEEHRKYRNLVAKAFRASQLERWDDTLVRPTIDRLLDEIAPLGRADLVAAVTSRYPVEVICGIVGVPIEDAARFAQWAEEINMGPLAPEAGHRASDAMVEYLRPLVEARRAEPTGDFLSDLVNAEIDGERLTDGKIYGFLRLLLPAGEIGRAHV